MQESPRHDELASNTSADMTPSPQEDRRRHARYVLSLAITMEGENNFYAGLSENISEAGVFIATHRTLPIGTPVVLSFTLPSSDEPLSIGGTVQWVRGPDAAAPRDSMFGADRESETVKPGMGVQFSDVGEESLRAIRAFMSRRSPEFFE